MRLQRNWYTQFMILSRIIIRRFQNYPTGVLQFCDLVLTCSCLQLDLEHFGFSNHMHSFII